MDFFGRARRGLLRLLPADNELLYRFGRAIVNRYLADNDSNMLTNGEMRFLREVLPGARVVFDVGANAGEWTAQALRINSSADYHCFEPSRATFESLSARGLPANVFLNNAGLGECVEERELLCFGDGRGVNSLYRREGVRHAQATAETVRIETLDSYCERMGIEQVDFVKLDVEGHEFAAIQGARRMLAAGRIDVVQFEYGGTYIDARVLLKDVWDFVRETNPDYAFYKIRPKDARLAPRYVQTMETFAYSNWAIMRGRPAASGGQVSR